MVSPTSFDPARDLPAQTGKTILITGGTAGLGASTLAHLAAHAPSRIIFTGRNARAADAVLLRTRAAFPAVQTAFQPCDLASLSSVRSAARAILSTTPALDTLILNAGVMATPCGVTSDGYEVQFGTNHLGHALLVQLLLPLLRGSPDARVVALTSQGYQGHPREGVRFDTLRSPQGSGFVAEWVNYGQSKLANILYMKELARREARVLAVPVHPGVITAGNLVGSLGWRSWLLVKATTWWRTLTPEQGGMNAAWAAGAARAGVQSGVYYEPVGEKVALTGRGEDMALAGELWEWTAKELEPWMGT